MLLIQILKISYDTAYMWNLKNKKIKVQMNLSTEQK